jgi:poly(U)-specific endoribonuclease
VAQVSQEIWTKDVNRLASADLTVNYQSQVAANTETDHASQRLFTHVDETKLEKPTYKTFLALLDNYLPDKGRAETATAAESAENSAFLNAFVGTTVSGVLEEFLICRGRVANRAAYRSLLTKIWLDFYPRSSSVAAADSSGFEHVLVGEYSSTTKVNGFHNWLSFYKKEKAGQLNYHGYVRKSEPGQVGAVFKWNGRFKSMGSFFVGVSPEFDLAIYSLCYLVSPNARCPVVLNGRTVNIQTFDQNGHIGTAYVEV